MNSPYITTLLFGLLAAVASIFAAVFYPWPEIDTLNERVNKALFEEYEFGKVRSLEIVSFNPDREAVERILLRRSGEKWVVPEKNNFVVTNVDRIANAVVSLKACTVLEVRTDLQEEQIEFGVVDPDESRSAINRASLGTKVTLKDRNQKTIASLIVGNTLKNETRRFARIAGEPMVYVTDYDVSALSTSFASWVNPNLMRLATPTAPAGQQPVGILVDKYQIPSDAITVGKKKPAYQLEFRITDNRMAPGKMKIANSQGVLVDTDSKSQDLNNFVSLGQFVSNIQFTDVTPKPTKLARALVESKEDTDPNVFGALNRYGFNKTGYQSGGYTFDAANGNVRVDTKSGMKLDLYVGNLAVVQGGDSGTPKRYVMLYARPNEARFPLPDSPAESADEETQKRHLRAVEDRNRMVENAKKLVDSFNRTNAKWFYVVDENILKGLLPTVEKPKQSGAGLLSRPTEDQ